MEYYHTILNLLSLVLVLSILFIVLFGCQFKKYRRIERFTDKNKEDDIINDDKEDDDEKEKEKKEESKDKKDVKEVKEETIETLEGFEGQILSGLTQGTITSKDMDKFINAGTFTKENLENIISYVEKFKSQFS
jgi:hypothetical protein